MHFDKWLFALLFLCIGMTCGVFLESQIFGKLVKDANLPQAAAVVDASDKDSTAIETPELVKLVSTPASGTPQLTIDEPVFNFGDVTRGNRVQHTFILRNTGDAPLSIERVTPTCGCTVADLSSNVIAAGGQAEVKATLNLLQEGPQNRTVLVQSNDPKRPNLKLSLVGSSSSRAISEPERVEFGGVQPDKSVSTVVDVRPTKELPFEITGAESSRETIDADVITVEPGKYYQVTIALKPPLPPGPFQGWVHLQTNDTGEYRTIGIPVSAEVATPSDGVATEVSLKKE